MIGGDLLLNREIDEQVQADTEQAEVVSLPITLIVMVLIFGGLRGRAAAADRRDRCGRRRFVCLLGFAAVITLDPNTVPVTTLLGLGISIDYALLMVSRFREERAAGRGRAGCGRADRGHRRADDLVLGADRRGLAVGADVFDDPTSGASARPGPRWSWSRCWPALTLVPALLALVRRPDHGATGRWLRPTGSSPGWPGRRSGGPGRSRSAWPRCCSPPARRCCRVKLQNGGADLLPDSFESVRVQQNLQVRFPGAGTNPVTVLARATPDQLDAYVAGLQPVVDRADVAAVAPAARLGTSPYASVDITPTGSSQGEAAQRLVHVLREHRPPYQSWVTGDAAVLIDFRDAGRAAAVGVRGDRGSRCSCCCS